VRRSIVSNTARCDGMRNFAYYRIRSLIDAGKPN